jgi:hypothetical protein
MLNGSALSMQLFALNCFVVLRVRRWGDRLCSRFDPNLESPVIYNFDGMQAVLNSRSSTSINLRKPDFMVEMCRCFVGYGFEARYFTVFGVALCYIWLVRRFDA